MAGTVGALAAHAASESAAATAAQLAGGQLVGHLVLSAAGHGHLGERPPTPQMLVAHAVAVVVGALLIASGTRLWRALSRVVRALAPVAATAEPSAPPATSAGDQPLQSMLLLAASISDRGPPLRPAR